MIRIIEISDNIFEKLKQFFYIYLNLISRFSLINNIKLHIKARWTTLIKIIKVKFPSQCIMPLLLSISVSSRAISDCSIDGKCFHENNVLSIVLFRFMAILNVIFFIQVPFML